MEPIALQCVYKSHRTTVDGAFSLTFELPENMADNVNAVYRKRDEALYIVVLTENDYQKQLGNSKG
jgi:hypothetical protein